MIKRTDGWAAQYLGVGTNKELRCLKAGQWHSTVAGGGGGSVEEKKDFGKPPCQFLMFWGRVRILKNIV